MFEFSTIFWGGAHRALSPDPSPAFSRGFALDARATPSMLGRFEPSARASPSMSPHQRMHIRYHTGTSFFPLRALRVTTIRSPEPTAVVTCPVSHRPIVSGVVRWEWIGRQRFVITFCYIYPNLTNHIIGIFS